MKLWDKIIIAAMGVFLAASFLMACHHNLQGGAQSQQPQWQGGAQPSRGPTELAQGGGFSGPSANTVTVAQAKKMRDDAPVILRGRIVKSLGNEKYTFADNTGEITVEIEAKYWGGLDVGPSDTVEISGEVDKEYNKTEIEVKSIRKL